MIYAIKCFESGRFKIGITRDPASLRARVETLRISTTSLDVVLLVPGDSAEENDAHALLAKYHHAAEWFAAPLAAVLDALTHPDLGSLYMTARQAAEVIGVSHRLVQNRCRNGEVEGLVSLPFVCGAKTKWLIPRSALGLDVWGSRVGGVAGGQAGFSVADQEKTIDLYGSGTSASEIARLLGVNVSTVLSVLNRAGVNRGRVNGERASRSKLKRDDIAPIREAAQRGERLTDIAARYFVTPQAISAVITRASWRHVA